MNQEVDHRPSFIRKRSTIIGGASFSVIVLCAICLAPTLFVPWQKNTHYPSPDLPWNGPDSRPIEQYKKTPAFMSTTGYNYAHRWYSSFRHKPEPNHYGRIIDAYVSEFDAFETWRKAGTVWYGDDVIEVKRAPYKFTFLSIEPIIVLMASQDPNAVIYIAKEGRFVSSALLENEYYYATSVPYHPDLQWFAPELKRGPHLLEIKPGETEVIEWPNGRLVLVEKDGQIISRRE